MRGELSPNTAIYSKLKEMQETKFHFDYIFNGTVSSMVQSCQSVVESIEERMKELEEKERWWSNIQERAEKYASNAADMITLNIGIS